MRGTITLTLVLFCCLIGHHVAKNFPIWLHGRVPADLQRVHGDFAELQLGWRPRNALKRFDRNVVRTGAFSGRIEGQNRNAIIGVHLQEDEAVRGMRGRHHLDLFRITAIDRNRVIEDLVAEQIPYKKSKERNNY